MLNNLPIEIVEQILFLTGHYDFIRLVKCNSRLYRIVHSQKSPFRSRLVCKQSWLHLSLDKGLDNQFTKLCLHCKHNYKIALKYGEYKPLEPGQKQPNRDMNKFYLEFVVINCEEHWETYSWKTAQNVPSPQFYIDNYHSLKGPLEPYQPFVLKFRSLPEAASHAYSFLWFFSNFYSRADSFLLQVKSMPVWEAFSPFFKNISVIPGRINLSLSDIQFNAQQFFSNNVFRNGIDHLTYENITQTNDTRQNVLHEKIYEAALFYEQGPITLDYADLSRFTRLRGLFIIGLCNITPHSIAKYVKLFYEDDFRVKHTSTALIKILDELNYEQVLCLIPPDSYSNAGEQTQDVVLRTASGKKFQVKIRHYPAEFVITLIDDEEEREENRMEE